MQLTIDFRSVHFLAICSTRRRKQNANRSFSFLRSRLAEKIRSAPHGRFAYRLINTHTRRGFFASANIVTREHHREVQTLYVHEIAIFLHREIFELFMDI